MSETTTSTTSHTKTPWVRNGMLIETADGEFLFWVTLHGEGGIDDAEMLANAALIVRAVNAHEGLVAAIQKAVAVMDANATRRMHGARDGADYDLPALLALRTALASVTP